MNLLLQIFLWLIANLFALLAILAWKSPQILRELRLWHQRGEGGGEK